MISFQKKTQLCCSSEICSDWKIRNNWNQAEHWRKQPQMDSHIGRNAQGKCNLRWTWNSSKPCTLNPLKGPFVFMIPRQQGSSRIVPARPSKSKKIFQDSCIPMSNLILKQVCFLQFFYLATYLVISAFLGVPFLAKAAVGEKAVCRLYGFHVIYQQDFKSWGLRILNPENLDNVNF